MKFDSHPTILVFGSQALAVILILMGTFAQRSDFHSERPQIEQRGDLWDKDEGVFRARLWEDPFRPLLEPGENKASQEELTITQEHLDSLFSPIFHVTRREKAVPRFWYEMGSLGQVLGVGGQEHPTSGVEQVIIKQAAEIGAERARSVQKKLLLIVSLNGSDSPEARELRLRSRYAMVSALLVSGYRSGSNGDLVPFQDRKQSEQLAALSFNRRAVLEWFKREPSARLAFENVVLLWVDDKIPVSPQETPDSTLVSSKTIDALEDAMPEKIGPATDVIIFDLGDSDRLRGLYQAPFPIPVPIYFLRASLSDELLQTLTRGRKRPGNVYRLAQQDDVLLRGAIDELKQRLPKLQNRGRPDAQVVLVAESDTSFSRGLIEEAKEALKDADITNIHVKPYTYLRGLDGKVESAASTAKKDNTGVYTSVGGAVKSALESRFLSEPTSGSSQFDYLRRLAVKIRLEEQRKKGRVVAVGILGSDVYDKLLVLQALRPELPQALFFTTDMDALYLRAGNEKATRNLIVASANDLDPDVPVLGSSPTQPDSWNVPPMRDSYEVSLFQATKNVALGNNLHEPRNDQVSLFEIGAGVYEPLQPIESGLSGFCLNVLASRLFDILIFLSGIFVGLWILRSALSFKGPGTKERTVSLRPGPRKVLLAWFAFYSLLLLSLGVLFLLRWLLGTPAEFLGEPVSWTSGVSLWPSLLIRLAAIVVALLLLRIASKNVQHVFFGLQDALEIPPTSECFYNIKIHDKFRSFLDRMLGRDPHRCPANVKDLMDYLGNHNSQWWRIFFLALGYWGLSAVLFTCFPANVPGRGGTILVIERFVLALGVGLYIVHLLYCLDVHFMAFLLLRSLRQYFSDSTTNTFGDLQGREKAYAILEAAGEYTDAAGRTLLYPFTVLVLIMLSRMPLFDAWRMTPSLWLTLVIGAVVLVTASLALVREATRLRKTALKETGAKARGFRDKIAALKIGAFAKWYQQPIFAALVSLVTVFGALGLAEPIVRLIVG